MEKIAPNFCVEYKKSLTASGVGDVVAFNDREIRLTLSEGGKVTIVGEGLKIVCFEKRTGEFKLAGTVTGVKFSNGASGGVRRLFK